MADQKRLDSGVERAPKKSKRDNGKPEAKNTNSDPVDLQRTTKFKAYDLKGLGIPDDALPFHGVEYKGSHSYTVNLNGAVAWPL